jgi:hypothetical protein
MQYQQQSQQQGQGQQGQQSGGYQPLETLLKNMDTVPHLLYGALIIVLITFMGRVPPAVSRFADSSIGRLLVVGLVLGVNYALGFTYGLLTAIALLLVIHASPRLSATAEGFDDMQTYDTVGTRWFVERVLGEQPKKIVTDEAVTTAVQDLSEKSMSHGRSK